MNIKPITFRELGLMEISFRWLEKLQVGDDINQCVYPVYHESSSDYIVTYHSGIYDYKTGSTEWICDSHDWKRTYLFRKRYEEQYIGPFLFETGEIVWFLNFKSTLRMAYKIHPENQPDLPVRPFRFEEAAKIRDTVSA